jgi:hypothetical protein
MVKTLLTVLLGLALLACETSHETDHDATDLPLPAVAVDARSLSQRVNDTSKFIAQEAFGLLSTALNQQIKMGGSLAALKYCNENALALTDSLAKHYGIRVQRLASRNRNPLNATNEKESQMLREWDIALRNEQALKPVQQEDEDQIHWYGAITIPHPRCLDCHGLVSEGDIFPETLAAIKKLYPQDKAVNFELGDLRGMWKISYPKEFFTEVAGN